MAVLAVIPARLSATRLPQKPLADLEGAPMVVRVWQRVCRVRSIDTVLIATGDPEIAVAAAVFGASVAMTGECENGTERVLQVALRRSEEWVVNVQGDEPRIEPAHVEAVVGALNEWEVATAATPLSDPSDPSRVKVVMDPHGKALYFSRQPIPTKGPWWQHLGIYAFRRSALERIAKLAPSLLEQSERLEQLRWLEAGIGIGVVKVEGAFPGVDTPEDLEETRNWYRSHQKCVDPPSQ